MRTVLVGLVLIVLAVAGGYWWGRGGELPTATVPTAGEAAIEETPMDGQSRSVEAESLPTAAPQVLVAGEAQSEPLPPADTPLASIRDELATRARAGDARAACRLGAELMRCRNHRTQQAITDMFDASLDHGRFEIGGDRAIDTLATAMERNQLEAQVCAGVDEQHIQEAIEFQRIAAQRGTTRMRLWYAARPAMDRERFLDQLDEWQRYRQLAPQYLQEALHAGDPLVIGVLTDVHKPPSRSPFPVQVPYRDPDPHRYFLFRALSELFVPREPSPLDMLEPSPGADLDLAQIASEAEDLRLRWFPDAGVDAPLEGMDLNGLSFGGQLTSAELCGE